MVFEECTFVASFFVVVHDLRLAINDIDMRQTHEKRRSLAVAIYGQPHGTMAGISGAKHLHDRHFYETHRAETFVLLSPLCSFLLGNRLRCNVNLAKYIPTPEATLTVAYTPIPLSMRGRQPLELRLIAPANGDKLPIVLLSHGYNPSNYIPS